MLLTKRRIFDPFVDLDRRFNSYPEGSEVESGISSFAPVVNTREEDGAYHIEVDLPGVKKEDINVDINNNTLSISGERKIKKEIKEDDYYKMESSYGKFQRSFSLPESGVDVEKISAKTSDGVLEVIIPKIEEKVSKKKISVK